MSSWTNWDWYCTLHWLYYGIVDCLFVCCYHFIYFICILVYLLFVIIPLPWFCSDKEFQIAKWGFQSVQWPKPLNLKQFPYSAFFSALDKNISFVMISNWCNWCHILLNPLFIISLWVFPCHHLTFNIWTQLCTN